MGSPRRHDSIHGTDQVRGTPPPTRRAKSRNGRGSRPGASATIARPRTSTFGTKPAAHWVAAACAACSPLIDERATSTTRVGVGEAACGHMWPAAGQLGTSCDRLDSPAPPCTPSQHNVASGARSTTGSCTAGAGMPRCGAVGPDGSWRHRSRESGPRCAASPWPATRRSSRRRAGGSGTGRGSRGRACASRFRRPLGPPLRRASGSRAWW